MFSFCDIELMGYSMGWFAFWDIELASSSIQYRALGTTKGGYRHASSKAMGHTRGYRRACSEAMGRRPGYRVALPRGPGHLRSTSARLLKSHGPKIRILKRVSPGPWAPEVDIGTPPQELSGAHPILTRTSPRPCLGT